METLMKKMSCQIDLLSRSGGRKINTQLGDGVKSRQEIQVVLISRVSEFTINVECFDQCSSNNIPRSKHSETAGRDPDASAYRALAFGSGYFGPAMFWAEKLRTRHRQGCQINFGDSREKGYHLFQIERLLSGPTSAMYTKLF